MLEENINLASLGGLLKQVMTEIIVEGGNSVDRSQRKLGYDTVVRKRFKIKNKRLVGWV